MALGERIFAGLLGLLGLFWLLKSLDLTYMDSFAPGGGFLPAWAGALLAIFSAAYLLISRGLPSSEGENAARSGDRHKPAAVAVGALVCIVVIEWLGFVVSVLALLVYLMRGVERLDWKTSAGMASAATLCLYLIFHAWLSVPLPRGPWGF